MILKGEGSLYHRYIATARSAYALNKLAEDKALKIARKGAKNITVTAMVSRQIDRRIDFTFEYEWSPPKGRRLRAYGGPGRVKGRP